jgi:hypothetical protein
VYVEGAELAEGGSTAFVPAHTGSFEACGDDALAERFDLARADLPAAGNVLGVVHSVQVAADVAGQQAVPSRAGGEARERSSVSSSLNRAGPPSCLRR